MMPPDMTETFEAPAAGDASASAEGEPPPIGADIMIGDSRWDAVSGLESLIPSLVAAALKEAGRSAKTGSVSIALLSGAEVRSLNKAFRGKDSATNVLSFPAAPSPLGRQSSSGPDAFLGDVALAYETVTEEALAQQKPVLHHAAHLVVHGVLHLAGLDHGHEAEAKHMEETERLILSKFGIPDPYSDDALPPSAAL
jgi:probable rRNA maturation factor